jgi:hypothetical protein
MRKVLSFVLVLALVLGSFSMAFGLTDIADSDNSEAITVANDLGIITGFPDGTFKPDQAVNRAEFAAMITRALGVPESALAGFTATSFKDTSGYTWAVKYLAFCESKGIMLGDGMGNAMPGRTINLNEAITMVLRAVGYTENSSELIGVWPSNYISKAQDLDLYDDVAAMVTVDRANAAQVIYNALTVTKVQVAADGATTFVTGNPNMLTSGLNCVAYTPAGGAAGDAWVLLGDEDSVINLSKYVGAYVTAYANKDAEIVAVDKVKSTYMTGSFDAAAAAVGAGDIFTASDDAEYTISAYTYDGDVTGVVAPQQFQNGVDIAGAGTFAADATVTIAAKVSGKKLLEVYSVNEWDATAIEWEDDMLDEDDCTIDGVPFVQTNNETIDYGTFTLVGANSLSDIEEGDVVSIFTAPVPNGVYAAGDVVKVGVGTEKVTGKIERVTTSKFFIGGVGYELSDNLAPLTVADLGDTGTASLDFEGKIAFWDVDDSAAGNYAVTVAFDTKVSFGTTTYAIKLFTEEGLLITPDLDMDNVTTLAGLTTGSVVEFSLDSDGKIDSITPKTVNNLVGSVAKDGSVIGTVAVANNPVVFVLDDTATKDADLFAIKKVADIDTSVTFGTSYTKVRDYGVDANSKIAVILIEDDAISSGDNTFGVINATSAGVNADGVKKVYVEGFLGKDVLATYSDYASGSTSTTKTAMTGSLQLIKVNNDGIVTSFGNVVTADVNATAEALSATVTAVSGNIISVTKAGLGYSYRIADNAVIYTWDTDNTKWKVNTISSLKGKNNVKLYQSDDDVIGYDYVLAY